MNPETINEKATPRGIALFLLLFAIGACYLLSLAYFHGHSINFVQKNGIVAASKAVEDAPPAALPITYTFDAKSRWTQGLAYGWNPPESWGGIWGSGPEAAIVLPPLSNDLTSPFCFTIQVGNIGKRQHWNMLVTIDGTPLGGNSHFSGAGPFEVHGEVKIPAGQPIVIRFSGPSPVIPRAVTNYSLDSRLLSFSLLGITVAKQCERP